MPDKSQQIAGSSIRGRWRDLEPSSVDQDNKEYAPYMSLAPATPMGHFEVTIGTSPLGLPSLPADARRVILYSETEPFTFTDTEGDSPSSTHGMIIPAETVFVYDTDPDENFLMWAAAPTVVRVAYYG